MRFSARLAASKGDRTLVLDDAPRATRIGFIKGVLLDFVGEPGRYGQAKHPLDTRETHRALIALIRDESDPWDYDSDSSWSALSAHLKTCQWPEFFDFVELIGVLLRKKDEEIPFNEPDFFKAYQSKVNALLEEDGIGWALSDGSELRRHLPKPLERRIQSLESNLTDKFAPARVHYQKAITYLYRHPIDAANSIKEIISALESVSRVIAPRASTLGDAIKALRKDSRFSVHMLDALERLYVYSNATPLVRHGHAELGSPRLPEAELALFVGVAYIRYLIEVGAKEA